MKNTIQELQNKPAICSHSLKGDIDFTIKQRKDRHYMVDKNEKLAKNLKLASFNRKRLKKHKLSVDRCKHWY